MVAKYEQGTRDLCNQLIDAFIADGRGDAAAQYVQQIPVRVIATMLGVPTDLSDTFTGWVRGVLEAGLTDPKVRMENRMAILDYFKAQIDDRKANPREKDLITTLLNSEVDGERCEEYVHGVCNLMLVAAWTPHGPQSAVPLWHLAQHPEHRRQLRDNPDLRPMAIEELLRAYAPVTMARLVDRDTEYEAAR